MDELKEPFFKVVIEDADTAGPGYAYLFHPVEPRDFGIGDLMSLPPEGGPHPYPRTGWPVGLIVSLEPDDDVNCLGRLIVRRYPASEVRQTPRVQNTIRHAEFIAAEYGHDYVGTEHLLIALAADPDGIAGHVLDELGVRAEAMSRARSIIASPTYNAPSKPPSGGI